MLNPTVAGLLVEVDPAGQALRLLQHVIRTTAPKGGAVLGFRGGKLYAVADLTTIDVHTNAQRAWEKKGDLLRAGRAVDGLGCSLTPLTLESRIVGILLLDGLMAEEVDLDRDIALVMAKALAAPVPDRIGGTPAPVDMSLSEEDFKRERVLHLCHLHQWNLSAVARALGTTRRTVYKRLERFHIPREKLPKTKPRGDMTPEEA